MPMVDCYVRLSDEDRDKSNVFDASESIKNQKSMLISYCMERGWQIHKVYCDEDYSGADKNRPGWLQMIEDCEKGVVDTVVCKAQSRFSRDMEMVEKYINGKFVEWGVRFIAILDNIDTNVAGNKKARQINGLINEWYLDDLSENIKYVLTHKKKNGKWTGSFVPYGYITDPKDKNHMVIDPVASQIVKEIFQMFADGKGYVAIAKELNERSIPNPTRYKRMNGSNFKTKENRVTSSIWTESTIYYIIRQEIYLGRLVQGKTQNISYKTKKRRFIPKKDWIRCENTHEAIISQDLWNRVHSRLRVKSRSTFADIDSCGERHIFSGKVFCAECGNRMYKLSSKGGRGTHRYKYLRCATRKNSESECTNSKFIRFDFLEQKVLSEINALIDRYYNPDLITIPERESKTEKRIKSLTTEKAKLTNEIASVKNASANLYRDRIKGLIDDDQFAMLNDEFWTQVKSLQGRLDSIAVEIEGLDISSKLAVSKDEIISKYKHISYLTHAIVDEFISAIYIGNVTENGQREIEIEWNF